MEEAFGEDYRYRLFGLALRSAIALPELERCCDDSSDVIRIRRCDLSSLAFDETGRPRVTAMGVLLAIANVAKFCVRQGHEILVDKAPGASDRDVRLFLLGSAMGVLLHQRRILPLHANAIAIDGAAVAFLGHSGAGKSTLAAAFHDRGRGILSDDVCAIVPSGAAFVVQPGIPRLRLWRDAVERSGRTVAEYERASDTIDKYTVATRPAARASAMPLKAIYVLARAEHGAATEIRRLSGMAAFEALTENTYRGSFIKLAGYSESHFQKCLAIDAQVPIFVLSRAWDAGRIAEAVTLVETHLRALVSDCR